MTELTASDEKLSKINPRPNVLELFSGISLIDLPKASDSTFAKSKSGWTVVVWNFTFFGRQIFTLSRETIETFS